MERLLATPGRALVAGGVLSLGALAIWVLMAGVDRLGLLSFALRFAHVVGAIVWVGLIWYVNLVQAAAVREASDPEKAAISRLLVPRVARLFRHSSHLTVLSGLLLLATTGYMLDRWIFTSAVYIPPLKNLLLWAGVLGALVMWGIVQLVILPATAAGLRATQPALAQAAREKAALYARVNLMLSLPVTFVMVAAAHLY